MEWNWLPRNRSEVDQEEGRPELLKPDDAANTDRARVPRGRPAKKGGKGGEPGGQGDRTTFTTFTALLSAAAGKLPVAGVATNNAR
jgi:hypothetical protein